MKVFSKQEYSDEVIFSFRQEVTTIRLSILQTFLLCVEYMLDLLAVIVPYFYQKLGIQIPQKYLVLNAITQNIKLVMEYFNLTNSYS